MRRYTQTQGERKNLRVGKQQESTMGPVHANAIHGHVVTMHNVNARVGREGGWREASTRKRKWKRSPNSRRFRCKRLLSPSSHSSSSRLCSTYRRLRCNALRGPQHKPTAPDAPQPQMQALMPAQIQITTVETSLCSPLWVVLGERDVSGGDLGGGVVV